MPNIVLYTSCILSFLNLTTCEIDIIIEEPIKEIKEVLPIAFTNLINELNK